MLSVGAAPAGCCAPAACRVGAALVSTAAVLVLPHDMEFGLRDAQLASGVGPISRLVDLPKLVSLVLETDDAECKRQEVQHLVDVIPEILIVENEGHAARTL